MIHAGGQGKVASTGGIPQILHQTWRTSQVPLKFHDWVVRML